MVGEQGADADFGFFRDDLRRNCGKSILSAPCFCCGVEIEDGGDGGSCADTLVSI